MLNTLLNILIFLGIIIAIALCVVALIIGVVGVFALVGKVVDLWKDHKRGR